MQKPKDNEENRGKCICPSCPLYSTCNDQKHEKFFCGTHKSACQMDRRKLCICGACFVYNENDLTGGYFCINEINPDTGRQ